MRVLLDENIPLQLAGLLRGHVVSSAEQEGWKGTTNGALLALAAASFDVMLTADASLAFQNDLSAAALSLVVLPTKRLSILRANAHAVQVSLDELAREQGMMIVRLEWSGRRSIRATAESPGAERQLSPVPPWTIT